MNYILIGKSIISMQPNWHIGLFPHIRAIYGISLNSSVILTSIHSCINDPCLLLLGYKFHKSLLLLLIFHHSLWIFFSSKNIFLDSICHLKYSFQLKSPNYCGFRDLVNHFLLSMNSFYKWRTFQFSCKQTSNFPIFIHSKFSGVMQPAAGSNATTRSPTSWKTLNVSMIKFSWKAVPFKVLSKKRNPSSNTFKNLVSGYKQFCQFKVWFQIGSFAFLFFLAARKSMTSWAESLPFEKWLFPIDKSSSQFQDDLYVV